MEVVSSLAATGMDGKCARGGGWKSPTTPPRGSRGRRPRREQGPRGRGARRATEPTGRHGLLQHDEDHRGGRVVGMRVKEDFPLSPVDVQHSAMELVAPRARSCPCLPACARWLAFKATNE